MPSIHKNPDTLILNPEYRKGLSSMVSLAETLHKIGQSEQNKVIIDLKNYRYIHPSYAVIVAAMPYIGNYFRKNVSIKYYRDNSKCLNFLDNNGILSHYNDTSPLSRKSKPSIDFSCITQKEKIDDTIHLLLKILPVNISTGLHDKLFSKIYEVFNNAFTHSGSSRVYFSGSADSQNSFVFTVYDTGIGIPQNVQNYLKGHLTSKEALEWALTQGNSTLKVDYPRGLGFSVLEEFVKINNGDIVIASGEAYCKITKNNRRFETMPYLILGTFFSITVKQDRKHKYVLSSEL